MGIPLPDRRPKAGSLHPIEVTLAASIKTGVEVWPTGLDAPDYKPFAQMRVPGMTQGHIVQIGLQLGVGHLPQAVNSSIRTPCPLHHDALIQQSCRALLQSLLHADEPILTLPAVKTQAVIGNQQSHGAHGTDPNLKTVGRCAAERTFQVLLISKRGQHHPQVGTQVSSPRSAPASSRAQAQLPSTV